MSRRSQKRSLSSPTEKTFSTSSKKSSFGLEDVDDHDSDFEPEAKIKLKKRTKTLKHNDVEPSQPKQSNPRKNTKESHQTTSKVETSELLSLRRAKSQKRVGFHASISGGLQSTVQSAFSVGALAFALFPRNQRRWVDTRPLASDQERENFQQTLKLAGYSPDLILPHGSYLVNLGSPDTSIREKSRAAFLEELKRCSAWGINQLNIHPGSSRGEMSPQECCALIAEAIEWALEQVENSKVILENSAGAGGTIGVKFEELRLIIDKISKPALRERVGVCLDTCHMFASGYDIRTKEGYEKVMKSFGEIVGFERLSALHLNDSKVKCGAKRDRHECLGKGEIGLDCFRFIMNDQRFNDIPLILETPCDLEGYKQEIDLLYSFEEKE